MSVLVISTLYPSSAQPVHAVFVEQRVAALAKHVPLVVLAPVPWFPIAEFLPRYAHRRRIPCREMREGLEVLSPRFLSIPRFLKPLDGFFLFLTCWHRARRLARAHRFERIDAHLAFPDGWAAVLLGRVMRLPVSVTLRGHDLNDLPRYPVRRRQVEWTLRRAGRVFAVADALRDAAIELGAPPAATSTVGNGVDAAKFFPQDRLAARRRLGIPEDARLVLSVGHLVERKGFHPLVRAFARVASRDPQAMLAIVGAPGEEGDYSAPIRRTIEECGDADRVRLAGAVAHGELAPWYAACNVFCLASEKEGRANVLLEAMACGAPIVATRVWGTPEIVIGDVYGLLVDSAAPEVLAPALEEALGREWDPAAIAAHGRTFSWESAARAILEAWR